jgi:hypothetical protein
MNYDTREPVGTPGARHKRQIIALERPPTVIIPHLGPTEAMKQPSLTNFFRPAPPKTVSSEEVQIKPEIIDKVVTFPVGTIIRKPFPPDGELFDGKIVSYDGDIKWYRVIYADGDVEDMEHDEVVQYLSNNGVSNKAPVRKKVLVAKKRKVQRKASPSRKRSKPATPKTETDVSDDSDESFVVAGSSPSRRQQRACSKKIKYVIDDTDDEYDDELSESEEESTPVIKRKPNLPAGRKRNAAKTTVKSKANDDSSDFEGMDNEDSDDELLDAASGDDEIQTPKSNPRAKPKKSTPAKKTALKPARAGKEAVPEKKKMSESFEAKNYPDYQKLSLQQIKEQKGFLDPCGMEATDGIIDRLVGEQVDKIGGLLHRALQHDFGSFDVALQLGTACSGTDAPALALGLVKEQMELRNMQPLNFTHEFSCEVDPFKQGMFGVATLSDNFARFP